MSASHFPSRRGDVVKTTFYLPTEVDRYIKDFAYNHMRSYSEQIREILLDFMRKNGKETRDSVAKNFN